MTGAVPGASEHTMDDIFAMTLCIEMARSFYRFIILAFTDNLVK
jgi:hypothetical protein